MHCSGPSENNLRRQDPEGSNCFQVNAPGPTARLTNTYRNTEVSSTQEGTRLMSVTQLQITRTPVEQDIQHTTRRCRHQWKPAQRGHRCWNKQTKTFKSCYNSNPYARGAKWRHGGYFLNWYSRDKNCNVWDEICTDGFNGRLEIAEEKINEFEDVVIETLLTEREGNRF